jgi:thioredoxin 1
MDDELQRIRAQRLAQLYNQTNERETMTTPDAPVHIDDNSFDQIVAQHPLVVVDCWAPWCGPCRMLGPVIDQMAKEYAGKIVFAKLNTDENKQAAMKYGIMSIPTMLVFKNGELADRLVGALPKPVIEQKLQPHM